MIYTLTYNSTHYAAVKDTNLFVRLALATLAFTQILMTAHTVLLVRKLVCLSAKHMHFMHFTHMHMTANMMLLARKPNSLLCEHVFSRHQHTHTCVTANIMLLARNQSACHISTCTLSHTYTSTP